MAECDDRAPLLAEEGGIRQRGSSLKEVEPTEKTWTLPPGSDYDPDLPYGGKVYMARKKKPDPLHVRVIEVRSRSVGLPRYGHLNFASFPIQ